jgi:hypothetical protein
MHHRGQSLLVAMLDWQDPAEEKALGRHLPLVLSPVVSLPRGWLDIRPPAGQALASASWRHQSALLMVVWEERFAEDLGEESATSFDDRTQTGPYRYQSWRPSQWRCRSGRRRDPSDDGLRTRLR